MGGAYQATGHSRFVSNIVDFDLHPQTSIDAPRSFADGGILKVERGYKNDVCQGLTDLGHNLIVPDTPIGGAQAILIDYKNGTLVGSSDARKDGASSSVLIHMRSYVVFSVSHLTKHFSNFRMLNWISSFIN